MTMQTTKPNPKDNGAVIIDIDGVVNKMSNRRFYAQFIINTCIALRHVTPNRKSIIESIKLFKKEGSNGLFCYIRKMSKDDKAYKKICDEITGSLNYKRLPKEEKLGEYLRELAKRKRIIVRTDGLSSVGKKVWEQVVGDSYPQEKVAFFGINETNFALKTSENGWDFAAENGINLSSSYLLDDRAKNRVHAERFGIKTLAVSEEKPLSYFLRGMSEAAKKETNIEYFTDLMTVSEEKDSTKDRIAQIKTHDLFVSSKKKVKKLIRSSNKGLDIQLQRQF
ncbi:MAG: hypothetical protein R3Y43_02780 [Alphaproteobacteria bacterium]